ncbi:putative amidoligase enzyme-domain-containing protein [Scenedesmus sp. NREL 46B-D3]|nr:putative amidoligase enzyme-domain-containing protein [Scenedesmus sp. NREL 46B-D3]
MSSGAGSPGGSGNFNLSWVDVANKRWVGWGQGMAAAAGCWFRLLVLLLALVGQDGTGDFGVAAGLQQIYKVVKAVKPLNPSVNKSCGLHVHIKPAHADWSLPHLKGLSYNWCQLESATDLLLPYSRRASNNNYCKSNIMVMRQRGAAAGQRRRKFEMKKDIKTVGSTAELAELVCPTDRYYKLNLRALGRHGTVEFRAAGGTQNAAKVAGYVLLFLNLADASRKGKKAPPPQQKEYVFENMVKFLAEHTGCVVLLHWLPRRRLELNRRSSSSSSSSSASGGPVSVAGEEGIVNELLKYGGNTVADMLLQYCSLMWQLEQVHQVPGTVVSMPKKGDLTDPGNYRGITLLSVLYKFYTSVLNQRLIKFAEGEQQEQQQHTQAQQQQQQQQQQQGQHSAQQQQQQQQQPRATAATAAAAPLLHEKAVG